MSRAVLWRKGIGYVSTLLKWVKTKLSENGPDTNCREESSKATNFARLAFSVVVVMAICYTEPASAGTGGKCNTIAPYLGYAWAEVTHTNSNGTLTESFISTPTNTTAPCAFVGAATTCSTFHAPLPSGAFGSAYAKAGPGAIIGYCTNTANCSSGNPTVENLLNITPGPCAAYLIADGTAVTYDPSNNGTLKVSAVGTEGTGLLFRGFEAPPSLDPNDPDFEQKLFSTGTLLFFVPLLGPFDTTGCPLLIPFSPQNPTNVWIFTDGAALGTPFTIQCPPDQVYAAGAPVVYPPLAATNGGCGNITVTYNPPASSLPCGTTQVTATATDSNGSTATCTFNAIRNLTFVGFSSPINAVSPDNSNCSSPVLYTVSSTKQTIPLKFQTLCGGVFFPGTSPPFVNIYSCPNHVPVENGFATKDTSNVWHFNVDLTIIPLGKYVADVQLQDGEHKLLVFQVGK
jgi:HYR domain